VPSKFKTFEVSMLYKIVHQIYVHQHNLVKKNYFADKKRQLKLAMSLAGFNK
jgi:hypothetical protein